MKEKQTIKMFFYNGDEDVLEWYKKGTGDESHELSSWS